MKLILAYYLKEEPDKIFFTSLDNIDSDDGFSRFINIEDYFNNKKKMLKTDLYSLMLDVLNNYYGNKYTNEIVDREDEYTEIFEKLFVYNFEVV